LTRRSYWGPRWPLRDRAGARPGSGGVRSDELMLMPEASGQRAVRLPDRQPFSSVVFAT